MQGSTDIAQIKGKITQALKENKVPHIMLDIPSMMNETPDTIRTEVDTFNQLVDYLIQNGQQCMYITAEGNAPITYEEWMILEDIVNESKREIEIKGAQTIREKARVIEHVILCKMPESVHWGDEDFYTSSKENLIQALKAKKGSCCHFATLTQYLHLRNNMYSDMIYSDVHVESDSDENIGHVFNLLFLGNEEKKWTFIDTMWEKNFLKLRERNRFSFVTLEDMQNDPYDVDEAHKYTKQDFGNIPIVSFNMNEIDRKLGYQNKICLFRYCNFIAYHVACGNSDKIMEIFKSDDESAQNILNKNIMTQYIGFISYICALELGNSIKKDSEEERDMIRYLYTYLKTVLPELYVQFFRSRLKRRNPGERIVKHKKLHRQASELFHVIQRDDGSVGIYFDDTIDRVYIEIDFVRLKGFPYVGILNNIQFEEKYGKIDDNRTIMGQNGKIKQEDYAKS